MRAGTMDRMARYTDHDWLRLGTLVRRRRTTLDLSQGALAEKAGVSLNTIGNVEAGSRARELNLSRIADALGWTKESCILVLEGGDPVLADNAEPDEDSLLIERPDKISDEEWADLREELVAEVQKYLRWRGGR